MNNSNPTSKELGEKLRAATDCGFFHFELFARAADEIERLMESLKQREDQLRHALDVDRATSELQPSSTEIVERMSAANAFKSPATANLWLAQGIREIGRLERENAELRQDLNDARNGWESAVAERSTHEPPADQPSDPCVLRDGVIYCQCGQQWTHYGTMGERGAREVRCEPAPPPAEPLRKIADATGDEAAVNQLFDLWWNARSGPTNDFQAYCAGYGAGVIRGAYGMAAPSQPPGPKYDDSSIRDLIMSLRPTSESFIGGTMNDMVAHVRRWLDSAPTKESGL